MSQLRDNYGVDYNNVPAEDYSLTGVTYEDENGSMCFSEARTSWCYSGPGLRLSIEVLGPEYSMSINSLKQELEVFFSRELDITPSEEFIEKQGAEHGLIPIIPDEALSYGYQAENRHMVKSFLNDQMPIENWYDGLLMTQLMMTAYKSAEEERTLDFNPASLRGYKPSIAKGEWRPL